MDDKPVDFCALEKELHGRIHEEERYWQQNDAKFRAVEQKVATYEEFRQMVMAAHLKPLDRTDKVQDPSNKFVIWNTIAGMNKVLNHELPIKKSEINTLFKGNEKCFITSDEFLKQWKHLRQEDRLKLLQELQKQYFHKLFDLDIPTGFLSDVFVLFSSIQMNKSNIILIIMVLKELSKSQRFHLNLQFLSYSEKNTILQVFDKLSKNFQNLHEELKSEGISNEDLYELKKKYLL